MKKFLFTMYATFYFLVGSLGAVAGTQAVTPPHTVADLYSDEGHSVIRINGEVMEIGGGVISSWVMVDFNGYYKVGLTLSAEALSSTHLPSAQEGNHFDAHMRFPHLKQLPFNHAYVAWKPAGHGPDGMYHHSHYDFHFAFITPSEMEAIVAVGELGQQIPPQGFMPENWEPQVLADGSYASVAGQGVHWHFKDAPEWHGDEFTETFMWGSYAGENIFMEPMITLASLVGVSSFEEPIELPRCVKKSGFYPQVYGWKQRIDPSGKLFLDLYLRKFVYLRKVSERKCSRILNH